MQECKPIETPLATNLRKEDTSIGEVVDATIYRKFVGFLMHLVKTRPKIYFVFNIVSQFMVKPTKLHWKPTKHVLKYLRGTTNFRLLYKRIDVVKIQGFIDVDWVGIPSDSKSTSRAIFSVGSTTIS